MKNILYAALSVAITTTIVLSCSKVDSSGYSAGPDETAGMVSVRKWTVHSVGYALGDTALHAGDTTKTLWAKRYDRHFDTIANASWVNNKTISFEGGQMDLKSANTTTRIFDTTSTGTSLRTSITYTIADSSIIYIYHKVGSLNAASGHYIATDDTFRTQ